MAPFGELFKKSWELYQKKLSVLAMLYLIPFVIGVIQVLVTHPKTGSLDATVGVGSGVTMLLALISFVVSLWISAALVFAINDPDNHPGVPELLKKAWGVILPLLLVGILAALAVVGGLILLIVPGIIFAVWFAFSTFTLLLEDKRGTEALKASKALVTGRWGAVFGRFVLLILSLLGVSIVISLILAILPLSLRLIVNNAVSYFVLSPLALIFTYYLYKDLKSKKAPASAEPAQSAASN